MSSTARRLGALALLCGVSAVIALRVGAAPLSLATAWRDPGSIDAVIASARGARVVLGLLAGGVLALVGASFQALFRNPLGDPYALGVSGGAALGATGAMLLGIGAVSIPLAAFLGALGAMALVMLVARGAGRVDATSMLLAGMVLNAASGAALAFLRAVVRSSRAQESLTVLLGVIPEAPWTRVALVAALSMAGVGALLSRAYALNLLALGEESAASLGVEVRRVEALVFVASSLAVAAVVSVCGLIPFVGLVVPHYARAWLGEDHRALLPACFFGGASLLALADAAARGMFPWLGAEPPVGALTALVGAPFFLLMLRGARGAQG